MDNGIKRSRLILLAMAIILVLSTPTNGYQAGQSTSSTSSTSTIEKGRAITRELKGGDAHDYTIAMAANQYLHIVVVPQGIDVAVSVSGPNGEKIIDFDNPNSVDGPEPIYIITSANGPYRLEIRSLDKNAAAGNYQASIVELREVDEKDKIRVGAFKNYNEAVQLQVAVQPDSVAEIIKKYQQASDQFQSINEPVGQADTLYNLAYLYYSIGEYGKADPLHQRALAIREKVFGPEHADVALSLNGLAVIYKLQGDYSQGESLYLRALSIREKVLGNKHIDVATTLSDLALLYYEKGEYDKGLPLYQRALTIFEQVLGSEHPYVATTLNNLALLYTNKGNYGQAEQICQRALKIREKALGPDHPDVAQSLDNLVAIYKFQGEYYKGEPMCLRALAIREKAFGPEHPDVAQSLESLAIICTDKGAYNRTDALLQRVLAIREKVFGPDSPAVAITLNNLGELYNTKNDFAKAESCHQRALAIREKTFGPNHPDVALSLSNLSTLYYLKSDFGRAESLGQRALTIREQVLGANHPEVARSLSDLALIFYEKGDFAKAETLFLRTLAIREQSLTPNHPDVASSLNNLGLLYLHTGREDKAAQSMERAVAIREKVLRPENPELAVALNNLATIYDKQGKYSKTEALYQRTMAIFENAFGVDNLYFATALHNLAETYRVTGAYDKADPLYRRMLSIFEKIVGINYLDVSKAYNHIALLSRAKGDINQAIEYKEQGDETKEQAQARNLAIGSEKEKLRYLNLTAIGLDQTISLHLLSAPNNDRAAKLALIGILRRKGRALDAMTDNIAILRRRAKLEDQQLLDHLADARGEYAKLSLRGAGKAGLEQYKVVIANLEAEIERLEKEVSRRSAEFTVQSRPITLTAIQQAIPDDAVLIEFINYQQRNAKDEIGAQHYAVYLLTKNGQVKFVDLGAASAIDQAITNLRQYLPDGKSDIKREVKPAARRLDKLVMQPVRKLLGDKKRLLISPDGALNLVPFDALVDEQNNYLVENYEISYLTSGRDLLRLQNGITNNPTSMIIADPDFANGPGPKLGADSFTPLQRLPATVDEAQQIKAQLDDAQLLLQGQATKAALISVNRPRIVHLATHGYFLSNEVNNGNGAQRIAMRTKLEQSESSGVKLLNPLLRSGLFFANANNGEEGTLTALEAAGLDLWGTKLVVLSACDTGVGEVKSGDGVYGLRRALVLAGSETQLMSLWPISDQGTRDLMVGYYKALKNNEGRSAGLRRVRLALLQRPERAHPYYWASFIPSGEWANLDGKR